MVGFETVGNATLIAYDRRPVLCTDPWIEGDAYFGSWTHRFAIPAEQIAAIQACEYVWFSHGHPDHLNAASLPRFRTKKILLPDHVGQRIRRDLEAAGFDVRILENRKWYALSDRIRVLCLSDYNQDSALLIELGGRLVINFNDCSPRDWSGYVRKTAARYERSFLLRIINHGDTDMINFFDEEGRRVLPPRLRSVPLGIKIRSSLAATGAKSFIPFSTFHVYRRTDSIWANDYVVMDPAEFSEGFSGQPDQILPANLRYDCETDRYEALDAPPLPLIPAPPEEFGDDWSERLDVSDKRRAAEYFTGIECLRGSLDFIRLVVGREEHVIPLSRRDFRTGVSFECPRQSLMKAVEWEIFDDLLIGNFMRTTLHGVKSLYPHFTPYVAKYADNGRARTRAEVDSYLREYRQRNPLGMFRHELQLRTTQRLRDYVLSNGRLIRLATALYGRL